MEGKAVSEQGTAEFYQNEALKSDLSNVTHTPQKPLKYTLRPIFFCREKKKKRNLNYIQFRS